MQHKAAATRQEQHYVAALAEWRQLYSTSNERFLDKYRCHVRAMGLLHCKEKAENGHTSSQQDE